MSLASFQVAREEGANDPRKEAWNKSERRGDRGRSRKAHSLFKLSHQTQDQVVESLDKACVPLFISVLMAIMTHLKILYWKCVRH